MKSKLLDDTYLYTLRISYRIFFYFQTSDSSFFNRVFRSACTDFIVRKAAFRWDVGFFWNPLNITSNKTEHSGSCCILPISSLLCVLIPVLVLDQSCLAFCRFMISKIRTNSFTSRCDFVADIVS